MRPLPSGPRKALGAAAILVWLVAWIVGAASLGELIVGAPWPLLAMFYAVAGVAWVIPLRPLFRWMNA